MKRTVYAVDRLAPVGITNLGVNGGNNNGWRLGGALSVRHQHLWITTSATAGVHLNCCALQSHRLPAAHKLLRKYRRHRIRVLRKKEYDRLRAMVPSIATQPKVSNVTVIEEAIKYIDHLHCAILSRFRTRGLPQAFQGMGIPKNPQDLDQSEIREMLRHMLPSNHPQQQQQQHIISSNALNIDRQSQSMSSIRSDLLRLVPRRPPT